ncbi:MAG: cyclophilin-like fold protein [Methanobrevibacter sp.]|nr:cyclophilin-like fold protein [Methanobrevibacter sp.]
MLFIKKTSIILIILSFLLLSGVNAQNNDNMIKLKVNDHIFDVELENNPATKELVKKLETGNVSVNATDYGNFEKVGDLGFSLPANDENIKTEPGDIVLYQKNQISVFYDSHSWSYTKLGKIQNASDLKEILGSGNTTLEFSLK